MIVASELRAAFERRFGATPRLYRAPGRINLIGEHTDYNHGCVLPAAIDRYARVAIAPVAGRRLTVCSAAFDETVELDLDALAVPGGRHHWSNYLRGAAAQLERAGYRLRGARIAIDTDLPLGGGLGSSAAFEVAVAFALAAESGHTLDPMELAQLCQRGDHEFAGVRCGLMDQFAACHGRRGYALLLDTRSLAFEAVPLPASAVFLVCNTGVRHSLALDAYNTRRSECEAAVRLLAARYPHIRALRDATLADVESVGMPATLARRSRYVIAENARVYAVAAALRAGDLAAVGGLLEASHRGLRDDYEVSCAELDALAEACRLPGIHGARMIGGGFGGCVLALATPAAAAAAPARIAAAYRSRTGLEAAIDVCPTGEGVHVYRGPSAL